MARYSVLMNHTTIINGVEFEKGLHAISEEEAAYFVTTTHRVTKDGNKLAMIPADIETKKDLMSVFGTPQAEEEEAPEDEIVEDETETVKEEAPAETETAEEVVEETENPEEAETETEKVDEKATEENVTTEDEAEAESDETDPEILATREEYEKVLGKTVSNRYMNDVKWMKDKIAEAQKAEA